MIRTSVLLGGACLSLLGLAACQNDPVAVEENLLDASIEFRIDSAFRQPDSASWRLGGRADSALLGRKPGTTEFVASFRLPVVPSSDSVQLSLWKEGMRINILVASGQNLAVSTYDTSRVLRDTVAFRVLRNHSVWAKSDSVFYAPGARGAIRVFAAMMSSRDSLARSYASQVPVGIDSIALSDEIAVAMARKKRPFDSLYSSAYPGPDSVGWRNLLLARVKTGLLTRSDSAVLFPPSPIRVETPISVKNLLVAGGDEVEVLGEFGWVPGMVVLDALVLSGNDTVRGWFDVAIDQPRSTTDTAWSLQGRATVRARSRAKGGDYRLVVVARDLQRRKAQSGCSFKVQEPPEGTPRLMRVTPAGDDTVRVPFDSASIYVEAKVFNPDSIKAETFTIGGVPALKVRDSVWGARVPLPPNGRPVIVAMRVLGKNDYPGTDYLLAVRSIDGELPRLQAVAGGEDREVPFEQVSAMVVWSASDNHRLDRVEIAGLAAPLTATGYAREVPLSVGENVVSILAVDSTGNRALASTKIVRRKDLEAPRWVRDFSTHDSDVTSENVKSILLAWSISDNHRLAKVEIGGVVAERSGGLYYRRVPVLIGETKIAMVATDSSGNLGTDTILVRKEPNPGFPVVKAAAGTRDTTVEFETKEIELGWIVLNPGSLKTFSVAGSAVQGAAGRFSVRVALPIGDTLVKFEATDTLGAKTFGQVRVGRRKDAIFPKVVLAKASFVTIAGVTTADVRWVVEDNHKLSTIKPVSISGEVAKSFGNQCSRVFEVPAGQATIRVSATDSCGNETLDSVVVDRTPDTKKPVVEPWSGTEAREVANDTTAVLVAWKVSDDHALASVTISGETVEGAKGIYARYVPLDVGANTIRLVAKDDSGNETAVQVAIVRK